MREYFNPDWMEFAFGVLFTDMWQAALLVAIASAVSLCLRRAAARSALWTACIIGLAVMPALSLSLPHCFVAYQAEIEPLHFPTHIASNLSGQPVVNQLWPLTNGTWANHTCRVLVVVWVAGAVVALMRLVLSWVRVASLLHLARPCRDARVPRIVNRVIPHPEAVAVLEMHGLVGAICWQIHRPKIILPAELHRVSDSELEMMIRHEWTHLRRSDPGALFVQRLVEILYWFHPLVWFATLQVEKYREFVCDDAVISAGFEPNDYARCLGQLAVWYYAPMPLAPAGLGLLWNQHLVLLRVKRLLQPAQPRCSMTGRQRLSLQLATALVLMFCSVLRVDWNATGLSGRVRWTAWPHWTAGALDAVGLQVRDFPLDAHRYDVDDSLKRSMAN